MAKTQRTASEAATAKAVTPLRNRRGIGWAAGGVALGAAFAFNRWSSARAKVQHPPIGDFVEVDGVRLHYVERGTGSPIVLIHGNGAILQDFIVSGLMDKLAANHRVIAFDRPGYGYSARPRGRSFSPEVQAALFVGACDQLGIEKPLVVGHSWGTLPALAWALDHADKVAGLVLLSGYYFGTPRLDAVMTGVAASPVIGDFLSQTLLPLQTRLTGPLGLKMVFAPDPVPAEFTDNMPIALMLRPSQLRATAADSGMMPIAAARLAERYAELTLPITIIWGDGDKLVDQATQSVRLAAALPHATTLELPGAGHMVHYGQCTLVADAIEVMRSA